MSASASSSTATSRRPSSISRAFARAACPHFIDGAPRAARSGRTFETRSPIDERRARGRGRRRRGRRGRGGRSGAARLSRVARPAGQRPAQSTARHRRRDRGARRGDRAARVARYGPADPLHVASGEARRRELPLLRRQGARGRSRLVAAGARARQLHAAPAARARRGDHAVEHAVHAVDVEDCAGACGRLHGRAQAGGVEPDHGHAARRDRDRGRLAGRRAEHWCTGSAKPPARPRPSIRDPRGGVRRRVGHRQPRSWCRARRR